MDGKLPRWIWGLVALGVVAALGGAGMLAGELSSRARHARMRVRVVNASGTALTAVSVGVSLKWRAKPVLTLSRPSLAPGEELEFQPPSSRIYVSVTHGGRTLPPHPVLIWSGERYLVQIRPDGTLDGACEAAPPGPRKAAEKGMTP